MCTFLFLCALLSPCLLAGFGFFLLPFLFKRRYAVKDDIPIMLIDEAETVDDAEHDRLMTKAAADGIQPTFDASS